MPSSVVDGAGVRARLAAAALVKENYSVNGGVEELGVGFGCLTAWAAVQEDD